MPLPTLNVGRWVAEGLVVADTGMCSGCAERDQRIAALEAENAALRDRVQHLEERLQALETRLAQDSQNSNKPPSSDGYTKPAPKSLRQKSGRKSGGQPGHGGHTLKAVDNPDYIVVHSLKQCPCGCGENLQDQPALRHEKRQVFDLPPQKLVVTEHQAEVKVCPSSGKEVTAAFPSGVTAPVQYDARFLVWLVYLRNQQLLPLDRIRQMAADLFGHEISEATVEAAVQRAHENLAGFEEDVKDQLTKAEVAHADETGARVEGKLHWVHVVATSLLTWYGVHKKRGRVAIESFGLLLPFKGRLIHDCLKSYFNLSCAHGLCNAHLLRELKFLYEELHQAWAGKMHDLLREMRQFVATHKKAAHEPTEAERERWHQRYRVLLQEGRAANPPTTPPHASPPRRGRPKKTKSQNLLDRLEQHDQSVLAFLYDFRVPFTNNQAEQDLRMIKVQQKISGTFRTLEGAYRFARIRGYISTVRKHGENVFEALTDAFAGQPFMPSTQP